LESKKSFWKHFQKGLRNGFERTLSKPFMEFEIGSLAQHKNNYGLRIKYCSLKIVFDCLKKSDKKSSLSILGNKIIFSPCKGCHIKTNLLQTFVIIALPFL
jgi:hypothetical protein